MCNIFLHIKLGCSPAVSLCANSRNFLGRMSLSGFPCICLSLFARLLYVYLLSAVCLCTVCLSTVCLLTVFFICVKFISDVCLYSNSLYFLTVCCFSVWSALCITVISCLNAPCLTILPAVCLFTVCLLTV